MLVVCLMMVGVVSAAETIIIYGEDVAIAAGAQGSDVEYSTGDGSWQSVLGTKMELYIDPTTTNLGSFKIDDIQSISYKTKKPGAAGDVDFYLAIYTTTDGADDESGWYGYRLNGEPYFSNSLNAPANQWNTWNTNEGDNQLTFFDSAKIGGGYGFYSQPDLQDLQAGTINWYTYNPTYTNQDIDYGAETVKYITFQTGTDWMNTFNGNIDAIEIELTNGKTLIVDLEKDYPTQVYVDASTTSEDYTHFDTIQEGINAVAEGGTVNVAAGTYDEDVLIEKTLTLQGAQVGVDARGRSASESEIVGVVVVTSDATNVVFDGFKFTSPTRAFNPRGFNLHIESESSTIKNNIFVAEENAGHTYSGYLDFGGITNTVVEYNDFSGDLDPTQEPNVIMLGISGAGTVIVSNNEMHNVGGGGGVGIMCTNAGAIINIENNEMDNTGDGIWVWSASTEFNTLTIDSNYIHNSGKIGVKIVGTVTGTATLSNNNFENNDVQVMDDSDVLDMEDVLANNIFDRAVVIDREGASLLHTIWSNIQAAIDAASPDDTINVADGTYAEDVVIDVEGLTLESSTQHGANIQGSVHIEADDVSVVDFKITDFGYYPVEYLGILVLGQNARIEGNLIDGTGIDPVANMVIGIQTLYGGTASAEILNNQIENARMGVYIQSFNGGLFRVSGNTIEDTTWSAIGIDSNAGV